MFRDTISTECLVVRRPHLPDKPPEKAAPARIGRPTKQSTCGPAAKTKWHWAEARPTKLHSSSTAESLAGVEGAQGEGEDGLENSSEHLPHEQQADHAEAA